MSVCVIAIFKNESHILQEWMEHYISQGIDKFFLIDHNSTDNYIHILKPYINSGIVELFLETRPNPQFVSYNDNCLVKCKQYDWAIACDLDEFIYARKGYPTIKSYLEDINELMPTANQIFIPWKMFGSNGLDTIDKPQPASVIQSFTKRSNYDKDGECVCVNIYNNQKYIAHKTIVKTKSLVKLLVHEHETNVKSYISTYNIFTNLYDKFGEISEHILEESFLHLNHYAIQSKQWFMNVKSTRGCVASGYNVRNEHYFHRYDMTSNDMDDFELRDITNERIHS
jgi:hypothetical protein